MWPVTSKEYAAQLKATYHWYIEQMTTYLSYESQPLRNCKGGDFRGSVRVRDCGMYREAFRNWEIL